VTCLLYIAQFNILPPHEHNTKGNLHMRVANSMFCVCTSSLIYHYKRECWKLVYYAVYNKNAIQAGSSV